MSDSCSPSPAHSIKLKPRAASVAIGVAGQQAPSSLPVSFDPDNPLTNDAHDAVLGGGHHPGKIPFQAELWDEVTTRLSEGVTATDGAPARRCVWSRSWVAVPVRQRLNQPLFTKKKKKKKTALCLC